ncbi:MAG: hypothetical protein V7L21_08615 [Nostoc sp.]|uniref:hypothetical protein n=1 Tax=Nostoc sp. TaxID=1180 RepID=UPI002FF8CC2B
MRTLYIEHAMGMFLQSLKHYRDEAAKALDIIYLDPWTNCKWKSELYAVLFKTEQEILKSLEDLKLTEENPQEVVKSLGEKLKKQSLRYAWSTGFCNLLTEVPYVKVQVETYNNLANMLFLISTIESGNVISLGL